MKQKQQVLIFLLFIISHISFGQAPSTTKKWALDYGEMEIEVKIIRLYSDAWDSWAETRHRWHVKAFNGGTTHATYSKLIKDNERPQIFNPNHLIYRKYVTTASLGTLGIRFIGFEDNVSYGALPGNSDKRDNRHHELTKTIDFNTLKLGTNYFDFDEDGYFKCRLKVTLRMGLPNLTPKVEFIGTDKPESGQDDRSYAPGVENLDYALNDKICEGRSAKIIINNGQNSPALIDKNYTIKLESHRVGENDISYTYQVQSIGGTGMQLNAIAPPGGDCDGNTTLYCGNQPYDPSCQECITTEIVNPHWDPVDFEGLSTLEDNPEIIINNLQRYNTQSYTEIKYRFSVVRNGGSNSTETVPIFIYAPEPVLDSDESSFSINSLSQDYIETVDGAVENLPNINITHVKDKGTSTGQIQITGVDEGTGLYNFYIRKDNGSRTEVQYGKTSATFSSLAAGQYMLVIENLQGDFALCYSIYDFIIREPEIALSCTASEADIANPGSSTGSITASPTGGVGSYQYALYSPNKSTEIRGWQNFSTFSSLPDGTYWVRVKDGLGVTKWISNSISIDEPSATVSYPSNVTPTLVGGKNYYVTCNDDPFVVSYQITDPDNIDLDYQLRTSGDYTGNLNSSGSHTVDLSGKKSGTYHLYAKKSGGNWHQVGSDAIVYNNPAILNTPSVRNQNSSNNRISCHDAHDGRLYINNIGGGEGTKTVELLTYPAGASASTDPEKTQTLNSHIVNGMRSDKRYKVRYTDELGCITISTNFIDFTNPDLIQFTGSDPGPKNNYNFNGTYYNARCFNDNVIITANFSGGWPGDYTVKLKNSAGTLMETLTVPTSGDLTFQYVSSGDYYLELLKDGCDVVTSPTFGITTPADALGFTSVNIFEYDNGKNLTCFNSGDGEITVETAGGVGNHTLTMTAFANGNEISSLRKPLTNGDNLFVFSDLQAAHVISGVRYPIEYRFELNDMISCGVNYTSNPIILEESGEIIIDNLSADEVLPGVDYQIQCKGGSTTVDFSISGGEGNYPMELLLSTGDNSDKDVSKIVNAPGNYSFTNVTAGDGTAYQISVVSKEHYDCAVTNNSSAGVMVNEVPTAFAVNESKKDYGQGYNVSCKFAADAELSYTVSGGYLAAKGISQTTEELSYTYDGVTQTLTNPQIDGSKKVFSNLPAENSDGSAINYTLKVYDLLGCEVKKENIIFQAPAKLLSIDEVNRSDYNGYQIRCNDSLDEIEVLASGGVLPYEYSLKSSDGGPIDMDITISTANTPAVFTNLPDGTYDLTLVDAASCEKNRSDITLTKPEEIVVSTIELVKPTCSYADDGQIRIALDGGILLDDNTYEIRLYDREDNDRLIYSGAGIEDTIFVAKGSYELQVTDDNNCGFNEPYYITMQNRPELTIEPAGYEYPLCYGGSTGKLKFNMMGGLTTEDYTARLYDEDWNQLDSLIIRDAEEYSFTEYLFDSLWAANYHIVIEDGFSCLDSMSAPVQERLDPLSLDLEGFTKTSCSNTKDGSITMKASGGDGDYVFSIDGINFYSTVPSGELVLDTVVTDTITYYNKIYEDKIEWGGLAGGKSYPIYLRDKNWDPTYDSAVCTIENTFFLPMTDSITVQFTTENVSCFGSNDGSLKATALLGQISTGFQYKWYKSGSNIVLGTENEITGLGPGTYDLLVYNETKPECSEIFTASISSPSKPLKAIQKKVGAVTCDGSENGVIRFNLEGGYSSISEIEVSINGGLSFERYTLNMNRGVAIRGLAAGNYSVVLRAINSGCSDNFQIEVPFGQLDFEVISSENPACNGAASGKIMLGAEYDGVTYQLFDDKGQLLSSNNDGVFKDLKAATFQVTAFQFNQCYGDTLSVTLVDPPALDKDSLELTNPSCGLQNGSIYVTAKGGTPPYQIEYVDQSGNLVDPEKLFAGFYQIKITDAKNCIWNEGIKLNNLNTLELEYEQIAGPDCDGINSYDLQVSGGLPPYNIHYKDSVYTSDEGYFNLKLTSGSFHELMASDQLGCSKLFEIDVEAKTNPEFSIVYQHPASCGVSNGWVEIGLNNASSSDLVWPEEIDEIDGMRAYGLWGGKDYTIYYVDENACSYPYTFSIGNKDAPEIQYSIANLPSCDLDNGAIVLSNDWADKMYLNGEEVPSTGIISISSGNHVLRATSNDGCFSSANITVGEIDPDEEIEILTDKACDDNHVELLNTGSNEITDVVWSHGLNEGSLFANDMPSGVNWVSFQLDNGCKFTKYFEIAIQEGQFWIADFQKPDCDGTNGFIQLDQISTSAIDHYEWSHDRTLTTNRANNVPAGTYEIIGFDSNNCEQDRLSFFLETAETDLTYSISEIQNSSCPAAKDGSIEISISGGTAPYQLFLDNQKILASNVIEGLSSGKHVLTIQDSNNCAYKNTFFIGYDNPVIIDSVKRTQPTCYNSSDGKIELFISGGSDDIEIIWANGSTGEIGTELTAGEHVVQIINGDCRKEEVISLSAPTELITEEIVANAPTCEGGIDGNLIIAVTGGTKPYSVIWSNGSEGEIITAGAGDYTAEVTDANNCYKEFNFSIPKRSAVNVTPIVKRPSCNGASNGEIELQIQGMEFPVIRWASGNLGATRRGLSAGSYSYEIEDQYGCVKAGTVDVGEPDSLSLMVMEFENPTCNNAFDGSIKVTASGGNSAYRYSWSNGDKGSEIQGLGAGEYEVTVVDSLGCTKSMTVQLNEPEPLVIELNEMKLPSCAGNSDASIEVTIAGGTKPYSYLWSDGSTSSKLNAVSAGFYKLEVIDHKGCLAESEFRIAATPKIQIDSVFTKSPSCVGDSDGQIYVAASGGTGELTYTWDTESTGQLLENIAQGTYVVTISDSNNCSLDLPVAISDPATLNFRLNQINDPICNGTNSGSIILDVVAGTPPYSYSWSNGETSSNLENIAAGIYSVEVTDASGCVLAETFELQDPPKYEIKNIDEVITICTGGSVSLDAGDIWKKVEWTSENGYSATGQFATISAEGVYTISAETDKGCTDSFEFELKKEDGILTADFVITSTSHVHDTIVVVDVSQPVPESVEWENDDDLELISQNDLSQRIIAREPGVYKIKMTAYSGTCVDQIEKWIEVTDKPEEDVDDNTQSNSRVIEGEFEEVVVSPNPNYGKFRLNVKMNISSTLSVKIFSPQMAFVIAKQKSERRLEEHQFFFDGLDIPEGFYIIRLTSEFGETTRKVIIK